MMKECRRSLEQEHFRSGFTLTEVLISFLIATVMLLPIYVFLNHAVVQTERACAEAFAISRLKGVMDVLMFQIPLRCIRSGNPCTFTDPSGKYQELLRKSLRKMFDVGYHLDGVTNEFQGIGLIHDDARGFKYLVQVKCLDLPKVPLTVAGKTFLPSQLTSADPSGAFVLMKKVIVEIRWSMSKHEDPLLCTNPRKFFLVGIKSDLES
jgi:hypothetical protein